MFYFTFTPVLHLRHLRTEFRKILAAGEELEPLWYRSSAGPKT